jgi:enterochelin esterase-like enzyme
MILFTGVLYIAGCESETKVNVVEEMDKELSWVTPAVNVSLVWQSTFKSEVVRSKVSYHIYIPELYEAEPERKFPVLYWLHGGGSGLDGNKIKTLSSHFDEAISAEKIPPMLVVFPHGMQLSMWVDSKDGKIPMETVVVKELVPYIDATYHTIASREGRLIEGFSMGGYGAARLGFKYHDIFGAVSMLGSGPLQPELIKTPRMAPEQREALLQDVYGDDMEYFVAVSPRKMAEENAGVLQKNNTIIRIVIGDMDETYKDNQEFHEYLNRLNIPHDFVILQNIPHNPPMYLDALGDDNWEFYRSVGNRWNTN